LSDESSETTLRFWLKALKNKGNSSTPVQVAKSRLTIQTTPRYSPERSDCRISLIPRSPTSASRPGLNDVLSSCLAGPQQTGSTQGATQKTVPEWRWIGHF